MKNSDSAITRLRLFLHEVGLEMKKSTWPDRKTLVSHTFIVIISVCMLGLFVGISDKILATLLKWLVPQG